MTLIKSLLLGSAAGIVAVASAQAADLPTRKGAPAAEYVRICNIAGITGFTLPGSDTCLKISGDVTAQYTIAGEATAAQHEYGMFTRGQVNFDAVSNTGAGPLLAHIELQGNYGTGFDSAAGGVVINSAFITWAGLTAGKHGSFFDYLAGGPAWDDFISPDHSGGPIDLLAYTVSAGGGFSATLSLEQTEVGSGDVAIYRSPDIIGQLKLTQAWGNVQLSGVAHDTNNAAGNNTWGFGVLGGLTFNVPGYAGADVKLQGVYAHDAIAYSGLGSPGNYNYSNGLSTGVISPTLAGWNDLIGTSDSSAWSVAGAVDLPISAQFKVSPELSYGSVTYSGIADKADAFVGGGVLEWTPVHNLVFDLDLLYINGNYTTLAATKTNYDGFNAKLRIERDF